MAIKSELPNGAEVLDLEAARVARAEARAKKGATARYIKLSAGYVEVQAEVPLDVADLFKAERIKEGLALLLADPADIDVLWNGFTDQDFEAVTLFIAGKTPGESEA